MVRERVYLLLDKISQILKLLLVLTILDDTTFFSIFFNSKPVFFPAHERDLLNTVRLITFSPKKYMIVENVEIDFRTQKKVQLSVWTIPQNYIERFDIL